MPNPAPLIKCLISSFIRNSVFLCFFSSLVVTYSFDTCLQLHITGYSLHMLITYLLISLRTITLSALLRHCTTITTHSVTVLPSGSAFFLLIPTGFATLPLWALANHLGSSAHMHTQASTFLSQWSNIAFSLPFSVDAHIFYNCMPTTTSHSLRLVLSDPFCCISNFLLLALLQHSVIVII